MKYSSPPSCAAASSPCPGRWTVRLHRCALVALGTPGPPGTGRKPAFGLAFLGPLPPGAQLPELNARSSGVVALHWDRGATFQQEVEPQVDGRLVLVPWVVTQQPLSCGQGGQSVVIALVGDLHPLQEVVEASLFGKSRRVKADGLGNTSWA